MEEIWKDVVGHEGEYQVSNMGRIKSIARNIRRRDGKNFPVRERILVGSHDSKGYVQVELRKDGERNIRVIHRIVADAFIPKQEGKTQINHIDGDKDNNRVDNLEWVTCQENIGHAWENGLNHPLRGENHGNHKLTDENVRFIRKNYDPQKPGCSAKAIAKRFDVSPYAILRVVNGKGWTHVK